MSWRSDLFAAGTAIAIAVPLSHAIMAPSLPHSTWTPEEMKTLQSLALSSLDALPPHAGPVADSVRRDAWTRIAPVRQAEISQLYANIGKAIAAYERRISFTPARFDRYVDAEIAGRAHTPSDQLSADEVAGLR